MFVFVKVRYVFIKIKYVFVVSGCIDISIAVYVCVCKGKKHVCMYLMRNINTLSVLNCRPK